MNWLIFIPIVFSAALLILKMRGLDISWFWVTWPIWFTASVIVALAVLECPILLAVAMIFVVATCAAVFFGLVFIVAAILNWMSP